jgi:serine/threonine protein kinase
VLAPGFLEWEERRRVEALVAAPGMVVADRYRLEEEIGHGGFSQVFRATELKLEREVALKLLSKDSVDAAGAARFRREAELARNLVHPNTVRLLDFDLEARPAPFIVYELLVGEPLQRLIKHGGAMPEARVAKLAVQVLKSLMEAHAAGTVHRDVKPGNVFVCTYAGEADFVKVLDFGIAKSTEPGGDIALTAAGMLVGTPRYMPPEQIRGVQPNPNMDLYAVGMMMAEMLIGAPVLKGTPVEACMEQLRTENIPLPEAVQRSRLGVIIRRATEKDAAIRFATAAEMVDAIEQVRPTLSNVVEPVPFSTVEDALPSGQIATQVMADPSLHAETVSGPHSIDTAPTVYAPLEAAPRPAPIPPAASGQAKWIVAAVLVVLLAVASTAALVFTWARHQQRGPAETAPAPTIEAEPQAR